MHVAGDDGGERLEACRKSSARDEGVNGSIGIAIR
jgi:hypothetical protein